LPVRAVADIYGSTRLCYGEIRATTVCLTAGLTGVIGLHSATVVHYTERQSPPAVPCASKFSCASFISVYFCPDSD